MKNRKRRIETFSFYDHTGISEHLEKMALQGWMIESVKNTGWVYRRMEPRAIHFAVSYYPKASEFDPELLEEQKEMHEFCEYTGWKLACTAAQMQIFYNEEEDPIPIETEPELEVQAIHASAKKSLLLPYCMFLLLGLLNGAMFLTTLIKEPIRIFSTSSSQFSGVAFLALVIICLVELGVYFRWYHQARKAAEQGEFLNTPSTAKFQKFMLMFVALGFVLWGSSYLFYGGKVERIMFLVMAIYVPTVFLIVNGTKNYLKYKKASRGVNRTVTVVMSFVVAFALSGLITFGMLRAVSKGYLNDNKADFPLVIEDLMEAEPQDYTKDSYGNSSWLLSQENYSQFPKEYGPESEDIPSLTYTVTVVKAPFLYDKCKEQLLKESFRGYESCEAESWGAKEVYQWNQSYLLCYEKQLVEITFDWEPTVEQKQIVSSKLGCS